MRSTANADRAPLLQTVITRLSRMLTRRGAPVEDMGQIWLAEPDADGEQARTLRPLQAAAITCRIAFGPRAGQRVLTLRGAMPREDRAHQPLCADIDGFSPHAAVRVEAHDRMRLEQLCRYITRPALSDERVQLNEAGQVELKLETPWRDGTTHRVMSPLEFMQRPAARVPRPRLHLIGFHCVVAPNAKLRALVVNPEIKPEPAPGEASRRAEPARTMAQPPDPGRIEAIQAGLGPASTANPAPRRAFEGRLRTQCAPTTARRIRRSALRDPLETAAAPVSGAAKRTPQSARTRFTTTPRPRPRPARWPATPRSPPVAARPSRATVQRCAPAHAVAGPSP
jgi:hypothetical protein